MDVKTVALGCKRDRKDSYMHAEGSFGQGVQHVGSHKLVSHNEIELLDVCNWGENRTTRPCEVCLRASIAVCKNHNQSIAK